MSVQLSVVTGSGVDFATHEPQQPHRISKSRNRLPTPSNQRPAHEPRRNAAAWNVKFTYASGSRPLDGYTIKRGIGRGGFGEVYYAVSDGGKEVALKLDPPQPRRRAARRQRSA